MKKKIKEMSKHLHLYKSFIEESNERAEEILDCGGMAKYGK